MKKSNTTRFYSDIQEKEIAKYLNGSIPANSGGTKFGGGDILTKDFLVEAKTSTKIKESFAIKLDWLIKADRQAYEQNKYNWALAFRYYPSGEDYFVINKRLMKKLVKIIEEGE